jgi:hypothetical protein
LDLAAGSCNTPDRFSRESNLFEGAARPSCPNTDVEHASVCLRPAPPRFPSQALDV